MSSRPAGLSIKPKEGKKGRRREGEQERERERVKEREDKEEEEEEERGGGGEKERMKGRKGGREGGKKGNLKHIYKCNIIFAKRNINLVFVPSSWYTASKFLGISYIIASLF
jgi:hypothetical protein